MKISPKHFPPISIFTQKKSFIDFSFLNPTPQEFSILRRTMQMLIAEGRSNIFTVSEGIQKMLRPNREKLTDAYWGNPDKEIFKGTYIDMQNGVPIMTLFKFEPMRAIYPKTGKEEECLDYLFANIQGNNAVASMGTFRVFYEGDEHFTLYPGIATTKGELHESFIEDCKNYMFYLMDVCIFLKYADVEVVTVYGKQRKVLPDKSDVIENKSGLRIKYIDSRWLREIIRTEGFKVRGHFRLQPMKDEDGEWTRKLIYINEFEKHGYHRRALRELSNNQG